MFMTHRITLLSLALLLTSFSCVEAKKKVAVQSDREYWAQEAYRMAAPVLEPMSRGMLSTEM